MTDLVFLNGSQDVTEAPDAFTRYTDAWLKNRRLSPHTRNAYRLDVQGWLAWCQARDLNPLSAKFTDGNAYARDLEVTINARTGRPLSATTVARKMSAVSSWYAFLVRLGAITANPYAGTDRPKVDRHHSTTAGLTQGEARALLAAADVDRYPAATRNRALVYLLIDLGLRVAEACRADFRDLGYARGHRVLVILGKGGKPKRRPLPPAATVALDAYLAERAAAAGVPVDQLTGPIFVTASGQPVDRGEVFRLIRRLARAAGIDGWERITPHSLRHTWNAIAKERGAALEDRQDAMGHVDPRTTRRYDRGVESLDRDPAYLVAAALSRGDK